MSALIVAVFVTSLVGSLHCAGMCGGVVALCVGVEGTAGGRPWLSHAAYHAGRMATYSLLGLVSGAVGAAIDLSGGAVGLPRAAAVFAGALMISFGVAVLLRARGVRLGCARLPDWQRASCRRPLPDSSRPACAPRSGRNGCRQRPGIQLPVRRLWPWSVNGVFFGAYLIARVPFSHGSGG